MQQIKYQLKPLELGNKCTTICPHIELMGGKNVYVGSYYCKKVCENFMSNDDKDNIVTCKLSD